MLMRQRDTPLNYDEPLGHALSLEELGNGFVATGAGRSSCRRTT
jgi:hypothetical protein